MKINFKWFKDIMSKQQPLYRLGENIDLFIYDLKLKIS